MLASEAKPQLTWTWQGKAYSLPLTSEDILTLARAVEHEGYPHEGVAWTLIQRAAWLNTRGTKVSLAALVKGYAQPINPKWFPEGQKHKDWVAYLEKQGRHGEAMAEVARAKSRPGKAALTWSSLSQKTRDIVSALARGNTASPLLGAVHYWASRAPKGMGEGDAFALNQQKKPELILLRTPYGSVAGRNVFFAEKGSERFGNVRIVNARDLVPEGNGPFGPSGGNSLVGALVGLTISAGAYFLWRKVFG